MAELGTDTESAEEEIPLEEEVVEEEEIKEEPEVDPEKQKQIEAVNEKLGVPEKPKKKNDFQTRINDLTKSFRTAERDAQDLKKKIEERDRDFEAVRKHNEELMGLVKSSFEAPPAAEGKRPDSVLKDLKEAKQKLISEKQKARSEVDYDKVFELQDKIDEVQDQINDVIYTTSQAPKEEDVKKIVKKVSNEDRAEENKKSAQQAADDFITKNAEWFAEEIPDTTGKLIKNEKFDPVKHYMAIGMEDALSKTWKGTAAELFKHIEDEVNKRFPPKAPPGKQKIPAVGGTGGLEAQSAKITLTSDQSRVARAIFRDDPKAEEKYAEKLKFMRGGK